MSNQALLLESFHQTQFTADRKTHRVLHTGSGPLVLVLHEMLGLTPGALDLGRRLATEGFRVAMPCFFGEPGVASNPFSAIALVCISREFTVLATGEASPVARWLRALGNHLLQPGEERLGVISICMTGGLALAMALDLWVAAPVLSQPSLPIAALPGAWRAALARDLGLSLNDRRCVERRAADGLEVLGLRFSNDKPCPAERFTALRELLGDRFCPIEVTSHPGNQWSIPSSAHSVLTKDYSDAPGHPTRAAYEQVVSFLKDRPITSATRSPFHKRL